MHAVSRRLIQPDTRSATLDDWRRAITQANNRFERGDDDGALAQYRAALVIADHVFGQVDDADLGVAALVISHHNAADTCERQGWHEAQAHYLCAAHERLCLAMVDPGLPQVWRDAALQHSRRTHAELLRFLTRHPEHRQAQTAIALMAPPQIPGGSLH